MSHIEMIIDYTTDGTDFNYSDNHGVLVRCKDCEYYWKEYKTCTKDEMNRGRGTAFPVTNENFFCGYGARRERE